jgi:hypothetical protein
MAAVEWVSVDEWAARHKITRQAAYKRIKDHQIPVRNGKLNADEADRIWFASYNPSKQNGGVAGGQAAAEARSEAQPTLFETDDKTNGFEQLPDAPEGMRGRLPQTALGRVQLARDLARANWERMRLDREQGKLVPINEVTRFYTEMLLRVRDELSSVGAETMNSLADTNDAIECCEIVDRRIEKALRSISEWRPGPK